jgi:hypothetical protein
MSAVHPIVRYLIVCEDVEMDPDNARRISIIGLLSTIRSLQQPPFPLLYREFRVFLQVTECRGPAEGRVEIRQADTDHVVFHTQTRTIPFGNDPLELVGLRFLVQDCVFPEPGLYWVQFWYNEQMIAQQSLVLR